jgi:hypothetical protein
VDTSEDRVMLPRRQFPTISVVGRLLSCNNSLSERVRACDLGIYCNANLNIRCCRNSLSIRPIGSCVFGRYVHSGLTECLLNTVPMGVLCD